MEANSYFKTENVKTKKGEKLTKVSFNNKICQIGVFTNEELETQFFSKLGELHTTQFFGISLFLDSDFDVSLDGTKYNVKSASVVMEYPEQRCKCLNHGRPTKSIHISFDQSIFKQLGELFPQKALELMYTYPHILIDDDDCSEKIEWLFKEMRRSFADREKDATYMPHMKALMIEIFVIIIRRINKQQPPNDKDIEKRLLFFKFLMCVNNYFNEEHNVSFYISELSTNKKALTKCVREIAGVNPKRFIDNRIIKEIKYLMLSENKSSKDVCYALGFKDLSCFSNFFKRLEGYTPTEYKEMMINKYRKQLGH